MKFHVNDSQNVPLDNMLKFISSADGKVRFDHYMQEHLFGDNGFYSERIEIGKNGHFNTRATNPGFAHVMYLWLKGQSLADNDFLEISGGNGILKRNYLQHSPHTNYISVDASDKLADEQRKVDGKAIVANADSLPLETASLEGVVFSNELIDALPCRVFRIKNSEGDVQIHEEGYVISDGSRLNFEYLAAEQDDFLRSYESFLRECRPDIQDGSIVSVSPMSATVISEMERVLKLGKIIVIDYGYCNELECPAFHRKHEETPFFTKRGNYHGIDEILGNPYVVDITYKVDFDFLQWIAKKKSFSNIELNYQHNVFGKAMLDNDMIRNSVPDPERFPADYSALFALRDFMLLALAI